MKRSRWRVELAVAAVAAASCISLLVACTAEHPAHGARPSAVHSAAQPASSGAIKDVRPQDGTIGTAALTSPDGTTSATLTISRQPGRTVFALSDLHTDVPGEIDFSLSPHAPDAPCPADTWSISNGSVTPSTMSWTIPDGIPGSPIDPDPTYLKSAVLTHAESSHDASGCVDSVVAIGALHWSIPGALAHLDVVDHGSEPHARGAVTAKHGHPYVYTIASDDTVTAIVARFGITEDELYYLNPFGPQAPNIGAGDRINLSLADRGAPPA